MQALRTPLQGLFGAIAQLSTHVDDPVAMRLTHELDAAARALSLLAEQFPDQEGEAPPHAAFTLQELLTLAVAACLPQARACGLALGWNVAPAAQAEMRGDAATLLQTLLLLLEDSLTHARTGEVRIQALRPEHPEHADVVALLIKDTALGAPPLAHPVQTQLDDLLRQLGGSVMLQTHGPAAQGASQRVRTLLLPLPGSVITVQNPIAKEQGAPRAAVPRRILLVDDYPPSLTSLAEILRLAGHAVATAGSGEEALLRHAEQPFDIVLMDLQLPDMDGRETTRRLRERERANQSPRVPVFAMTAYASYTDARTITSSLDLDGFIEKPLELEALMRLLESLPQAV